MKCFPTFCQSGFFISCLNSRQQRTKVFFFRQRELSKVVPPKKKNGLLLCYYDQLCQGNEMMDVHVRSLVSSVVNDPRYKR